MRADEIEIECPKCKRRDTIPRELDDPKLAVRVHIQCPKCNGGDFDTPHYFDARGCEVAWHEKSNT